MEVTQGQPKTLKGLSQFLVEHEPCGAGFDVSHPAGLGSGKVSMTCRGCGVTYEYATATIEFEREVEFEFEPVTVRTNPVAPPPPPPPHTPTAPPDTTAALAAAGALPIQSQTPSLPPVDTPKAAPLPPPPIESGRYASRTTTKKKKDGAQKNRTRDRVIAAVLLVLSVAAMAFAVLRVTGQNEEEASNPVATPPASSTATPKPDQPSQAKAEQQQPPAKESPAQDKQPKQPTTTATGLEPGEKLVKTAHFSVIVPDSWKQQDADGGSLLAPPGDSPVSVQVFYENDPGMSKQDLAAQTASFLRSRDPGAKVGAPKNVLVDGNPGFELHASGPAGSQVALGALAGSYRYLIIESSDPNTPRQAQEQADRALDSFKPR